MTQSSNSRPIAPEQITFKDVIYNRRSTRGFLPEPVPQSTLDEIFKWAQQAPSNCNIQPWKVYVASGETKDKISSTLVELVTSGAPQNPDYQYPGKFEGEYRRRQVECAVELYGAMGIERDDKIGRAKASLRNYELFDAPHVLYIGMHKNFGTTVALDVGMYAQTLMLAMAAHGVASCAQGALRYYPDIVKECFDIPEDINILFGISFGYEDTSISANNTRVARDDFHQSVNFK